VWPTDSPENLTPGLIELCRDWVGPSAAVAEIGCFAGVSTAVFANFAGSVLAVDPWEKAADRGYADTPAEMLVRARAEFAGVCREYPNIRATADFSAEAAGHVPDGSLDLVYIDGDHTKAAFLADVRAWRPKVRPGGLLAGHDYDLVGGYFAEAGLPPPERVYPETSWVVRRGEE
jgi:predicted O-methyltransferase YrrM